MRADRRAPVPWRQWQPGTRVVVRYRLPDGRATDALGTVTSVDDDGLEILTKRGPTWVAGSDVLLGKPVPPPPEPRRRRS